jgi:hypothetical protein
METSDLLVDAFGRVRETVHGVVAGLTPDQLSYRPEPQANSIAWLVWHLTRIEDDHVADLAGTDQAWIADGWFERFGLPFDKGATGYGHDVDDVAAVKVDNATLLTGYQDAVHDCCIRYARSVDAGELDRIVDTRWDPPVSAGVRLVSVIEDAIAHGGQAAYVRGLIINNS